MAVYKLSEVISIISGGTPKTSIKEYWDGEIGWISIKDIIGSNKFIFNTEKTITELGLKESSTNLLIDNDIIISARGTVGEIAMIKVPMAFNQSCFGLRVKNKNIIDSHYLYYWLKLNSKLFNSVTHGSVFDTITLKTFNSININIPSLSEQEKIIEIIKPFEDAISNINEQVNLIKKILINKYNLSNSSREYFCKYIKLHTNNYSNQTEYLATNAIGEFTVDYSKTQDIKSDRPSRADLTPEPNSIIISKLDGENKVLYIPRKFSYVVSTGFFNFRTEYLDHVVGFLLSEDYKKQKTMLATGTTMVGLNSDGLNQIKFKFPTDKSSSLTNYSNELLNIKSELENQREIIIKLLIK